VRNPDETPAEVTALFRVNGKPVQLWDPVSGEISKPSSSEPAEGGTRVGFPLPPEGTCFVVFSPEATAGEAPEAPAGPKDSRPLEGPWNIDFTDPWGAQFTKTTDKLKPLNEYADDDIRFFSGNAAYSTTFQMDTEAESQIFLTFDEPGDVARVTLNGEGLGIKWTYPFRVDISEAIRPGENKLTIEVTNNWANILCGEARKPEPERRYHTNISKLPNGWHTPFEDIPNEEVKLTESGVWNVAIETY